MSSGNRPAVCSVHTSREKRRERLLITLTTLLIIASSNLGLVNTGLAIKARDGGNLVGIRDLLLAIVLTLGMLFLLKQKHTALQNPLTKISFLVVCLSPLAALVGISNGAPILMVARDLVIMIGWLLAYVIGTNLRSQSSLQSICSALIVVGLLVALGVFVEAATAGTLRVVTPADVVASTQRSTPSGWPLMMIAASLLMTRIVLDPHALPTRSLARFAMFAVILVASLLTQSRTLIVGLVVSGVVLLGVALLTRTKQVYTWRLAALLALIPVILALSFVIGERLIRNDFIDYFTARYSVFNSVDSLVKYSEQDTRRAEIELGFKRYIQSPLLGLGLGSRYRDEISSYFGNEDRAILVHNVFAFFLFRYGPLGLLLFCLLGVRIFVSLVWAFNDPTDNSLFGIGLSLGLISLIACGIFGNVFATTYGTPITMIALGTLISSEEQSSAASGHAGGTVNQSFWPTCSATPRSAPSQPSLSGSRNSAA